MDQESRLQNSIIKFSGRDIDSHSEASEMIKEFHPELFSGTVEILLNFIEKGVIKFRLTEGVLLRRRIITVKGPNYNGEDIPWE